MNTRLYYTEPWLREFEARVVEVVPDGERARVWLDRTAFYPTSGGQPFDTGRLGPARVLEVIDGDDGRVVHVVDAPLEHGAAVTGSIDWARRFDHMQQHTGQHLLSAAFEHLHHVRTESFRMGAECSTIDLAREVTATEIASAEDAANGIVWQGREVLIRFVDAAEAARLPLRKEPVKEGRLRLIEIEGYDLSACGGTHVSSSGEVGMIAVRAWERFKGGTRLEFVCGGRALASYRAWRDAASAAARLLTVQASELPVAVDRLQQEHKEARRACNALAEKAAGFEAGTLASRASDVRGVAVLVESLADYDVAGLKRLASSFVKDPGRVAVLLTVTPPVQVVAMRSADVGALDMASVLSALMARFGGRGGGKREGAQGGGLSGAPGEILEAARTAIAAALA
jgi:alanyl-tRNA synthetase